MSAGPPVRPSLDLGRDIDLPRVAKNIDFDRHSAYRWSLFGGSSHDAAQRIDTWVRDAADHVATPFLHRGRVAAPAQRRTRSRCRHTVADAVRRPMHGSPGRGPPRLDRL